MTNSTKDGARDGDLRPIQPEKAIPSDAEVRAQADNLAQDIDVAAQDTGAIIDAESPQAVELAGLVADSKAGAEAIVADQSDTKAQEQLEFDYSGAESWDELYAQIKQRMGAVDANHVIEAINLFREGKINERDLPVTPDSHIIEVAVKLKLYDIADGKKFTPKAVDKIEATQESVLSVKPITEAAPVTEPVPVPPEPAPEPIPTPEPVPVSEPAIPEKVELSAADVVTATVAKTENKEPDNEVEPLVFDNKPDIRDARAKGNINRLKVLLDEINMAIQKNDRALKQKSLEQAAILLDDPRFATQSTELPAVLEQAQNSIEKKIKNIEIEIKAAQLDRLIWPLKKLVDRINSVKSREDKLSSLQEAAQLLNQPDYATAILHKSKEEQDLLVPDALERSVLSAEAKIRKIEEEINKLRTSSEPGTGPEVEPAQPPRALPETPEPNPEPIPTPESVPAPEPVMSKKIEKDLGYLDIDPKVIWEKLTTKDLETLQTLMKFGDAAKITEFYQVKIKEILLDQKKDQAENEVLLKQTAESINNIIQQTLQIEAERELADNGLFTHLIGAQKGKIGGAVRKMAWNATILGGTSFAIGALGIATGGVGILASAGGVTIARLLMRRIEANRRKTTPDSVKERNKQEEAELLAKEKAEVLADLFSPDNLEKLRKQLSGHIANVLREQTSGQALEALKAYQQADGEKEPEVLAARLRDVEKQLYLNALTKVRAENPEATLEQQQNMALTMALTLGQHERGENLARKRLEEIKKSKPALYKLVEKYNLLYADKADGKPEGMTAEENSLWQKSKYDLMTVGIGASIGFAVRRSDGFRIAFGALAGAGLGYRAGEWLEKRDEQKALVEIVKMIDESEQLIKDIEFPTDQLDKLKQDSIFVKSKLDLGLLESNSLLKSRAENFIHQVQKIELANQASLQKLLESVSQRTDKQSQQLEDDLDRIGGKIKNRKLWTTIGGAVVGGGLAWLAGELTHKEKEDGVHKLDDGDSKDIDNLSNKRPEINTIGASAVEPGASITEQVKAPEIPMESEVHSGDSVWKLAEEQLKQRFGDEQWSAFGEARQTHMIDEIKDQIAANREAFGLHHDVDDLRVGEKIDFSPIFEKSDALDTLAAQANEHGSADLQNILDNNEALRNSGVHLTEENVNSVINEVRNHGTAFLSPDGVVHDWTYNGQAVERLADGSFALVDSHQPLAAEQLNNVLNHSRESAQQLIDTEVASKTAAEAATAQAAETASKAAVQQQVETFLTQGGNYNHDLFEAAKSSGHLDDLVNRVVDSGNETQTSALVWDYVRDQGWSEDKIRVFMGAMRHGDKLDLSSGHFDLHDPQIIAQNMEAFEKAALDSFDRVKDMPSEQWMPARIGDTYFNIQKIHDGIWPLRSDHYLIDTNGDFSLDSINLDDHAMRAAFHRDSFDLGSYKK